MIKNKSLIALSIFMSLGLLGLLFPAVGASLPGIERFYAVKLSSSGMVSTLVQLGYAIFCLAGGILSDFFGKKRILVIGAFVYGVSGLLLSFSQSWILTLVLFFIFGSGSGMIFIASNTLVIDLFAKRSGTFLNIHHTFFSIGSLAAPFAVRGLLASGFHWYTIFQYLGVLAVVLGVLLSFSDTRIHAAGSGISRKDRPALSDKYRKVLKEKRFIQLLLVVFLGIGVQFGIIYLLVSFMIKVRGVDFSAASLIMSGFFALILLGRLGCSYIVSRISPFTVVLALLIMLAATLFLGWFTTGTLSLIMLSLTGLATSGLMPTLIAIAGSTLEPSIRASALGLLSMAGGLGGMLTTLTVTRLSDYMGFSGSFAVMIVLSVIAVVLFIRIMAEKRSS